MSLNGGFGARCEGDGTMGYDALKGSSGRWAGGSEEWGGQHVDWIQDSTYSKQQNRLLTAETQGEERCIWAASSSTDRDMVTSLFVWIRGSSTVATAVQRDMGKACFGSAGSQPDQQWLARPLVALFGGRGVSFQGLVFTVGEGGGLSSIKAPIELDSVFIDSEDLPGSK